MRGVLELPVSGRLEGRVGRKGGPCLPFPGHWIRLTRLDEFEVPPTPEEAQR